MKKIILSLITFAFPVLALSACSQAPEDTNKSGGMGYLYTESNDVVPNSVLSGSVSATDAVAAEQEGPQYQEPNMDVLRGKAQLYPAKYPVKRYPNSRVAMVDVRPNRAPGYKNMVMLTTDDEIPTVSIFYAKDLIAAGWKKISEYQNESYESSTWIKGERECEVRIAPDMRTEDKMYVQLLTGIRLNRAPSIASNIAQ